MSAMAAMIDQNVYGVTYASLGAHGLHFESELTIQRPDGGLTRLAMPTPISERQAISEVVCHALSEQALSIY